jgi:hypothetical protein
MGAERSREEKESRAGVTDKNTELALQGAFGTMAESSQGDRQEESNRGFH